MYEAIADSEGSDRVVIFIREPRSMKILPPNRNVCADEWLKIKLNSIFGAENVKFLTKPIEKQQKID